MYSIGLTIKVMLFLMELLSQSCVVSRRMVSHSVTYHLTQMNKPSLNPSQTGRYSIYLLRRDGRLSWPIWPVT